MIDLNVLDCSPLISFVRASKWTKEKPELTIACRVVAWFYWVVDGIYPPYRFFLKAIPTSSTKRERKFAKVQETFRKGVERRFGVF